MKIDFLAQVSICDSLDSELIREAMESLELELVAEGLYNVTIIDYETGMNHHIKVLDYTVHICLGLRRRRFDPWRDYSLSTNEPRHIMISVRNVRFRVIFSLQSRLISLSFCVYNIAQ